MLTTPSRLAGTVGHGNCASPASDVDERAELAERSEVPMRMTRGETPKAPEKDVKEARAFQDGFLTDDSNDFLTPLNDDMDSEPSPGTGDDEEIVRNTHRQVTNRAWRALLDRML